MTIRLMRRLMIAGLVASSASMAGAVPGHVAASAPAANQYRAAGVGVAQPVTARAASTSASPNATRLHGTRSTHAQVAGSAARGAQAPLAASSSVPSAGTLLRNFNGVSSLDSAQTNFGAEFEPPDPTVCSGNGYVLAAVNSAYRIYRTDGSTIVGPFNINDIFNVGAAEFTSDPRCYYDSSTQRWFVEILFLNASFTASAQEIAVSKTSDPTKMWTEYSIDTTDNRQPSSAGCPCFGDQPLLGIDANNIYISTNEFSINGPQYNGAQIYAINKAQLVAGGSVYWAHWANLHIGGTLAASVQPALTNGSAAAEYFLNSLDPNGTFDNRLGVWAMTNTAATATGHAPTLSSKVITSEPYGVPPKAQQKGSASLIDSGDDRMQQTQFINGTLWGALTTAVTIPNDASERAGAAWFAVRPSLSGSLIGPTTIGRQGYEAEANHYLIYPAIQAAPNGVAAMVFTRTSAVGYPSAAYAMMPAGASSFGAPVVAAAGQGPYDANATRWGDYSFAVLDPSGTAFWMVTEYVPPKASQTSDGRHNWGTRVIEVSAG